MKARLVVLVSGAGTNLQALLDACADGAYGAAVVAVGADRTGIEGLARARRAAVPVFTHRVPDHPSRAAWNDALTQSCAGYRPDLVISAGFMKLVGPAFLDRFAGRFVNTHPSLLPAFPGIHAVVPIREDDDEATLHERIKVTERALLVDTVGRMVRDGWSVEGRAVRVGQREAGRAAAKSVSR